MDCERSPVVSVERHCPNACRYLVTGCGGHCSSRSPADRDAAARAFVLIVTETATMPRLAALVTETMPSACCLFACSATATLRIVVARAVDLVLVDLRLSVESGLGTIEKLTVASPVAVCAVMPDGCDSRLAKAAFSAGAAAVLSSDRCGSGLIGCRLSVPSSSRLQSLAPRLAGCFTESTMPAAPQRPLTDDPASLSAREEEVLRLIAKGLSISDTARALGISSHTVCSHVKKIYRKRSLASRAEAALEARRLLLV